MDTVATSATTAATVHRRNLHPTVRPYPLYLNCVNGRYLWQRLREAAARLPFLHFFFGFLFGAGLDCDRAPPAGAAPVPVPEVPVVPGSVPWFCTGGSPARF